MKFLIIPEISTRDDLSRRSMTINEDIRKTMPTMSVANLVSFSVFTKTPKGEESSMGLLSRGYFVLSNSEVFKSFDVYIGYLLKEDFDNVDFIIYESQMAKEISDMRFFDRFLPRAREVVICNDIKEVANAVYERAVIRNFGAGK